MNVCIGAKIYSQDGVDVGKLKRIIFYPRRGEVTHLVIHKGVLSPHDTIVSMSMVQGSKNGNLTLRVDSQDVGELPQYREGILLGRTGPAGYQEVVETPSGERFSVEEPQDRAQQLRQAIHIEPGSVELGETTEVEALGGRLGTLHCLQVDQYANHLTYLVVEQALLAKKATYRVPAEWVNEVRGERITLSVPLQQAVEGPLPPAGPYIPVEPSDEEAHY